MKLKETVISSLETMEVVNFICYYNSENKGFTTGKNLFQNIGKKRTQN